MPRERFLTVKDICTLLHVSRWTVQRAIKNEQLREAVKVSGCRGGAGGTWRVPTESFDAWVQAGTRTGPLTSAGGPR